jgi:mannose-6-phosphate isomerase-like protein (cupin superfamily)
MMSTESSPVQAAGSGLVEKPWGHELRWAITDRYLGKIIHINKGHQLSLQYHNQKDESIYVVRGVVDVVLENEAGTLETYRLTEGMSVRVAPKKRHRFVGVEDCDIVEVSSPEIDDVVRLEDSYGREGTTDA